MFLNFYKINQTKDVLMIKKSHL